MDDVATITALLAAVLNTAAGLWGGWCWWQVAPQPRAWVAIRLGQVGAVALAAVAGAAYVTGSDPDDGLFWLYAVLAVPIGFFAEQFRALSARTVLDARGLEDAAAVGALPEPEQRSIVLAIVRRELGVMAVAAGVSAFLALRAAGLTDGL